MDYSSLLREVVPILGEVAGEITVSLLPDGGGAAVTVENAIWTPGRTEPSRSESDKQIVSRGTLTIDPSVAPGLSIAWRATVNGVTYVIEYLSPRAPLLDLELVRYQSAEIAQEAHRVRR